MSSQMNHLRGGCGYRALRLTKSQKRFQGLQTKGRAAFGDSIEFSKMLYRLLVDSECTDEQPQYNFTFAKRKEAAYRLVHERINLAREVIDDCTTGAPLVPGCSLIIFEDEICKLIKLYEKLHTKEYKKAAAAELEAYKKKLVANRILIGASGWQEQIAEREQALVQAGKQLILPKLMTDPNAVEPEAQPKKDYTFRPASAEQDHTERRPYKPRPRREMVTA